jgi:hypothetical protein
MQPIPTQLGWTTHKPHATGAPNGVGPDFSTQLQSLLQQTRPAQTDSLPSRAVTGHLHPGGMNDAAHRLLKLSGKG